MRLFGTSLLVTLLSCGVARATPAARTAVLKWDRGVSAQSCVDGPSMERLVEERLGRAVFTPRGFDVVVSGQLRSNPGGGFRAALRMQSAGGVLLGTRHLKIEQRDCRAGGPLLALVIAIMLDPEASISSTSESSVGEPTSRQDGNSRVDRSPPDSRGTRDATNTGEPAAREAVHGERSSSSEGTRTAVQPSKDPAQPLKDPAQPPKDAAPVVVIEETPSAEPPLAETSHETSTGQSSLRVSSLFAGAAAEAKTFPSVALGGTLRLSVAWSSRLSAAMHSQLWVPQTVDIRPGVSTRFSAWEVGVGLCPRVIGVIRSDAKPSMGLNVDVCAGAEMRRTVIRSSGFDVVEDDASWALRFTLRGAVEIPVVSAWSISGSAEVIAPVRRDRFTYREASGNEQPIFRADPLGARFALGPLLRF